MTTRLANTRRLAACDRVISDTLINYCCFCTMLVPVTITTHTHVYPVKALHLFYTFFVHDTREKIFAVFHATRCLENYLLIRQAG
jgi:hypothetical protein